MLGDRVGGMEWDPWHCQSLGKVGGVVGGRGSGLGRKSMYLHVCVGGWGVGVEKGRGG